MLNNLEGGDYRERFQHAIHSSPPEFQVAIALIGERKAVEALNQVDYCIQQNVLAGDALCIRGFCFKEIGNFRQAIESCRMGRKRGVGILGLHYYYDAMVNSLNNIDDLQGALTAVDEAIAHFQKHEALSALADHLSYKSNILKQMASHFSRDETKQLMAKEHVIGAIQALCESLSISSEGWKENEILRNEIDSLHRIAGRVGVKTSDLAFLSQMSHIFPVVEEYFSHLSLARAATNENYNCAVDWYKRGNRLKASEFYQKAFDACSEATPDEVAFKAMIAYFYGVNLLRMFDIENLKNLEDVGPDTKMAIEKIRSLWSFTVSAYSRLDSQTIKDVDRLMAPGISYAVAKIREDRIMYDISETSEWKTQTWKKYPQG